MAEKIVVHRGDVLSIGTDAAKVWAIIKSSHRSNEWSVEATYPINEDGVHSMVSLTGEDITPESPDGQRAETATMDKTKDIKVLGKATDPKFKNTKWSYNF